MSQILPFASFIIASATAALLLQFIASQYGRQRVPSRLVAAPEVAGVGRASPGAAYRTTRRSRRTIAA